MPTMPRVPRLLRHAWHMAAMLLTLVVDAGRFLRLCLRSPAQLAAENLFLRKQLALYQERHVKPRRVTNATRFALVWLGPMGRLEASVICGATGDLHPLASPGIPAVLAVEIQTGSPPDSGGAAST